jgi:segregation and condensation protein A
MSGAVIEANSDSASTATANPDPSAAWRAVKLPMFEGPLDLLLHLIRTNEVDISDIPVALISAQYLEYLEIMQLLDIDVAAEYLLMAATLAHIKSRMLLPSAPGADEGEVEDPRAELARRLAQYAVFKEAAVDLGARPQLGRDVFSARIDRSALPPREAVLTVSMVDLIDAMRRVLAELPVEEREHRVLRDRVTAQNRMVGVMDELREVGGGTLLFEALLRSGDASRRWLLMTFLAILELAKMQAILIFQNSTPEGLPIGPIRMRLAVPPDPSAAQPTP